MRIKQGLNKTSQLKLKKFGKLLPKYEYIENQEEFLQKLEKELAYEVRSQRTCSERAVVDYWFEVLQEKLNHITQIDDNFFKQVKQDTRRLLVRHYTNKTFDNNVDIYFNDVKREYILHPQNESYELEFIPENYDIFVKNNLKTVVNCAKAYREQAETQGLTFEDVIQWGNVGLLTALEKFDTNRDKLKGAILEKVNEYQLDTFTYADAEKIIRDSFTYDNKLQDTLNAIPADGFATKADFVEWINENIKSAVFASVAFKWIRATITNELNKAGAIVAVPKKSKKDLPDELDLELIDMLPPEYKEDYISSGNKMPLTLIQLDSVNPYTDDCYHDDDLATVTEEAFAQEDEAIDNIERKETFKIIINNALSNLPALNRRIVKKRFGIDLPYDQSINDIAESENISVNKVKTLLNQSLTAIENSLSKSDKNIILNLL